MQAHCIIAPAHRNEARVHGGLREVAQAFQRKLEQSVPARRKGAENIGLLTEVVAPAPCLLLDQTCAHQGEQEPPSRGLVEAAFLNDVAQLRAALGLPPDKRQQPQGAVHTLRPLQIAGRELSIIHLAGPFWSTLWTKNPSLYP